MLSMTGFGQGLARGADGEVAVQLAALNNRSWTVHLRSDLHDLALEELVRGELKRHLLRGSVTAQVAWRPARTLGFDLDQLEAAWRELAARARACGAPPPALEAVAPLLPQARATPVSCRGLLEEALLAAIRALGAMRQVEGEALARDLTAHARTLRQRHAELSRLAAARMPAYREALLARLREVLGASSLVGPEQLVRELAVHAERIDVSEELVRLATHLDALDALLASQEEAVGRKLEFLLQECGREVSTTAAKANDAAMTTAALDARYVLEQMKEQAANIA
jgi:uncharacterized protein YicC (UPF0701 family)